MEDRVKKDLGEIWTHKTTFEMTQSSFVSIDLIDDMINVLSDSKYIANWLKDWILHDIWRHFYYCKLLNQY